MDKAALWGKWGGPPAGIIGGKIGSGKSFDQIVSFPWMKVVGPEGGTKPAVPIFGERYAEGLRKRFTTAYFLTDLPRIYAEAEKEGHIGVYTDDITVLAEHTHAKHQKDHSEIYEQVHATKRDLIRVRRSARERGLMATFSAHLAEPKQARDGGMNVGGPAMPAPSLVAVLPVILDFVYVVRAEPGRTPWGYVYTTYQSDDWATKCRHMIVAGSPAPMNLGEIFRMAGYAMPRMKGMEWIDDAAEEVAVAAMSLSRPEAMTTIYDRLIAEGRYNGHAYLAVRNGIDRYDLRKRGDPFRLLLTQPAVTDDLLDDLERDDRPESNGVPTKAQQEQAADEAAGAGKEAAGATIPSSGAIPAVKAPDFDL